MAVNLHKKYAKQIQSVYTMESFIKNRSSSEYSFMGIKSLQITMPQTVPMGDYKREGTNRYGEPVEMQDTIQELTMTQDKSASITVDKGNNMEQQGVKSAGKMMRQQINEQSVPTYDIYCLGQYAQKAGTIKGISTDPSKTNILDLISDASVAFDEALVPDENRYIVVTPADYAKIRLAPDYVGNDDLGKAALAKGKVGEIFGFEIVKVPSRYIPKDAYFVAWHKKAVLAPQKLHEAKLHEDAPGISGALMEFRDLYDAFVLEKKCGGVYAAVKAASVVVAPTITISSGSATLASTTSGAEIKYTLDGSDPRYSQSAKVYSSAVTVEAGVTIKCYADKSDMYASSVALKTA